MSEGNPKISSTICINGSSEESRGVIDPLWFLRGISMASAEFRNRCAFLIMELEEEYFGHEDCWDTRRTALLRRIRDNANWLFQCWAYAFFHLEVQENVGYSGHVKALQEGVFGKLDEKHWNCIRRGILEFLKETYPLKVERQGSDTQKWFYENCWFVGCRENCSAGSSMVNRVLGYADYLAGDANIDVDEIVGSGYFCATLENPELLEACKNALTKEDAIGHDVITSAINGFREKRGVRPFRDGYWCYNSFRRGIDLVFWVGNGQLGNCGTLELEIKSCDKKIQSQVFDGCCRFRLEDIVPLGRVEEIKSIRQVNSRENLVTDEIKDGFKLLMDMLGADSDGLVAFTARSTGTLHPIVLTNNKEFECARLSSGIWVVGYDANRSNAYILSGFKKRLFAAYVDLDPSKDVKEFSFGDGKLKFMYKSSRQEKTVIGLDSELCIYEKDKDGRIPAFSQDSVKIFKDGEQCGDSISGSKDNTVAIMRRDSQRYVYIPSGLKEKIKNGVEASDGNWKYSPCEQSRQELAITGIRKGTITAKVKEVDLELLVECELESNNDKFWIEDRGIVENSKRTIDDDNKLEPLKLCVVPARRYSEGVSGHIKVKCSYQDRTHNEEFDFSNPELVIGAKTIVDLSVRVVYKDVRQREVQYSVLKIPLKDLLRQRNENPQSCEEDRINAGPDVCVKVLNCPKEVIVSDRAGTIGIYIPQSAREKTFLLVSEKWLEVSGEMCDFPAACKAIKLSEFSQSKDGWYSIENILNGFGDGAGIYGTVLPSKFVELAMADQQQFRLIVDYGCIKWMLVKPATTEVGFLNFDVVERKLRSVGSLNGGNGFDNAVRALLGRDLSPETFYLHWRNVSKANLRDFLDEALRHGINFLAIGGGDGDEETWYRKTWLSNVFVNLCHRELDAQIGPEDVESNFRILSSFREPDLNVPRLRRAEIDRRNALRFAQKKVAPIMNALQGDAQVLSSALTSFLLESEFLIDRNQRSVWPRGQENCQQFQDRTRTWRESGVEPLKQLSRLVNNREPLDVRIWPLRDDGRDFFNPQPQRDYFVGQNRITSICRGPLEVDFGTGEECCSLAGEAQRCCDTALPECLRCSCVAGVLSGIFDNIQSHARNAGREALRAELLFVAVIISRMTAFLDGRSEAVNDDSMEKVREIVRGAFHNPRAWKLAMFYTTAVDLLVWFGTKVDNERRE